MVYLTDRSNNSPKRCKKPIIDGFVSQEASTINWFGAVEILENCRLIIFSQRFSNITPKPDYYSTCSFKTEELTLYTFLQPTNNLHRIHLYIDVSEWAHLMSFVLTPTLGRNLPRTLQGNIHYQTIFRRHFLQTLDFYWYPPPHKSSETGWTTKIYQLITLRENCCKKRDYLHFLSGKIQVFPRRGQAPRMDILIGTPLNSVFYDVTFMTSCVK